MKHDQKQLGKETVYLTYMFTSVFIKRTQDSNSEQGRNMGVGGKNAGVMAGHGLLVYPYGLPQLAVIEPSITSSEVAPPIVGWPLLHQSLRKCPTGFSMEAFSQLRFPPL